MDKIRLALLLAGGAGNLALAQPAAAVLPAASAELPEAMNALGVFSSLTNGFKMLATFDLDLIADAVLEMDINAIMLTILVGLMPVFIALCVVLIFSRSSIPAHEINFLRDLYASTDGDNWRRNYGWETLNQVA